MRTTATSAAWAQLGKQAALLGGAALSQRVGSIAAQQGTEKAARFLELVKKAPKVAAAYKKQHPKAPAPLALATAEQQLLRLAGGAVQKTVNVAAGKIASRIAGGAAASLAAGQAASGGAVVAQLLGAAGVASTVPVAGWLVAGGVTLGAGVVAIVRAAKKKKGAELAQFAANLGIPDAASVPFFALRVAKMSGTQRARAGQRLAKALDRVKGKRRKRIAAKLALLAAADLLARAAKRQKRQRRKRRQLHGADGWTPTPLADLDRAIAVFVWHKGHYAPTSGFGFVDGAAVVAAKTATAASPVLQQSTLSIRIKRGFAGDLTEGGVVDPREAAAFVYGYLLQRYTPARQAEGKLTKEQAATLAGVALPFNLFSGAVTADMAAQQAQKHGSSPAVAAIEAKLSAVFPGASWTGDPHVQALAVLRRGAALYAAAKEPGLVVKLTRGVNPKKENTSALERIVAGAKAVVSGTSSTEEAAGATGVISAALKTSVETAETHYAALKAEVRKLADAGETGIKDAVEVVETKAKEIGTAIKTGATATLDKTAEEYHGAVATLKARINTAKQSGSDFVAESAAKVEEKIAQVTESAGTLRDNIAALPSQTGDWLDQRVSSVAAKGTELITAGKESITDVIGAGKQKLVDVGEEKGIPVKGLLWLKENWGTVYFSAKVIILGLAVLFAVVKLFRAAATPRQITTTAQAALPVRA